ncbi:hypothetical protein D3C75_1360650 [compost metagenome]
MIERGSQQLLGGVVHRLLILICQRLGQPVIHKELFPEAAAFANGRKLLLYTRA